MVLFSIGIIERNGEKRYRLEVCPGNKGDEESLMGLIKKNVAKETKIHSDCCKAHKDLVNHVDLHKPVNHSKNFVNPEDGAHTQNIKVLGDI